MPYPPELAQKLQRQIQHVLDTGETLTDETPYTSPAGQGGVYEYIFRPVRSADGASVEFVAGSTRDITARKQAEDERTRLLASEHAARAEAEAAVEAKDRFMAVLSHELRTPLMPVTIAVNVLRRDRSLSKSAHEALEMIERNVAIEAHFIDDLLDLTRITSGKLEIVREPVDLHRAVRHAVEVTASNIEDKRQQITVALDAREHSLTGDATRLQQVFWNLLRNAAKFTPAGGRIHVVSRNEPGRVVVEVSDTGVGFDAEVATRIFVAFEQASLETAREFGGLGLGLAISKATVDAHGGTVRARSDGARQRGPLHGGTPPADRAGIHLTAPSGIP